MSVSGKVNSRQIWLIFRNSVLIILISAVMLCLACAGFIAAVLTQELFDQRAEFRHRLAYAYQHDHQQFPLLSEPVLIFSRSHSPLGGSVVLVYALDRHAQDYFPAKRSSCSWPILPMWNA